MKPTKLLAGCMLSLFLSACGSGQKSFLDSDVMRAAIDVPAQFETPSGVSMNENSCTSPLIDPRTGTTISMVRSSTPLGDYEVPEGLYGVNKGELLRIRCSTGEVVGIVKR
jgi:hypothetical protein